MDNTQIPIEGVYGRVQNVRADNRVCGSLDRNLSRRKKRMSIEVEIVWYWVGLAFFAGLVIGAIARKGATELQMRREYAKGKVQGYFEATSLMDPPLPYPTARSASLIRQEARRVK